MAWPILMKSKPLYNRFSKTGVCDVTIFQDYSREIQELQKHLLKSSYITQKNDKIPFIPHCAYRFDLPFGNLKASTPLPLPTVDKIDSSRRNCSVNFVRTKAF